MDRFITHMSYDFFVCNYLKIAFLINSGTKKVCKPIFINILNIFN